MKSISKVYKWALAATLLLTPFACNDILEEQPRSVLTPGFFSTSQGLNSGITAAYSSFRYYYATQSGMNLSVYGTDEFTHGQQVTNPPFNVYSSQLNSGQGDLTVPWNRGFAAINTCNGIIEYGPNATDLSTAERNALIAEAKFIRANWYFILVQTFGGVSLDLGSGNLKFNTSTSNNASRSTIAEVYDAIVQDLVDITDGQNNDDLPTSKPTSAGHAWKASALHLLSKVYLTRGWSSAAQTTDFQKAYDTANDIITNKATYGVSLLPDYRSVFQEGNEYNAETLFQVNWIDNTTFNNNTAFGGPAYQNNSLVLFRCLYVTNMPGLIRDVTNGRPFVRYKPTAWLMNNAFADKVNDSRYNKSFQTVWKCNSTSTLNTKGLALGDTAVWMVPAHLAASVAPTINSRKYVCFLPDQATDPRIYFNNPSNNFQNYAGYNIQNQYYPSVSKFNSTQPRPNNDPNIMSVRPFVVYRFAETHLIAAEAALKLGKTTAEVAAFINVIRDRAGDNATAKANMVANTITDLATGGIDYILDERARELCGEQMRWFDLVRTGKLIERVNLHNGITARPGNINPDGSVTGSAQEVPNPQTRHLLRPIPQGQIDASVDPTSQDGKYPQNAGY